MWRRAFQSSGGDTRPSTEPWYRRSDVWLVVGAILLPFGWLLVAARVTWGYARSRRTDSR